MKGKEGAQGSSLEMLCVNAIAKGALGPSVSPCFRKLGGRET